MEGTFPSVGIVEARAMPLPTTTSITILSSPTCYQARPGLDAGSLTQMYSSLCATLISSSNTPQLNQQAVTDLYGKGLAAAADLQRKAVKPDTLKTRQAAIRELADWLQSKQTALQQDCTDRLIVDSHECRLFVPADKKAYIRDTIAAMLEWGTYTNRQLASVAGMLMSVSAAVSMAPLYTRKLYQSMGENMDNIADDLALAREDLQYWYDCIELCDGRSWLKRAAFIHVYDDASKVEWRLHPKC
ncbi:TPA: hypothetical protein ACH3X1_006792 [Trebouxia sp. C0004]